MYDLLVILGATATGKTRLAVQLADQLGGEIISADSRQVYRGLDIGSGKDLHEYGDTPYHLIDHVDPRDEYSVYHFQQDFFKARERVLANQHLPILVGGTGLYIDAVISGYRFVDVPQNPVLRQELAGLSLEELSERLRQLKEAKGQKLHNNSDLTVRPRLVRAIEIAEGEEQVRNSLPPLPKVNPFILGIRWPRAILRKRITERLNARLEQGMIDEVKNLLAAGVTQEKLEWCGLEYRFVAQYVQGQLNYNDMKQKLNSAIHQFAKRQETWFRGLERKGWKIHWLEGEGDLYGQASFRIEGNFF